MGCCQYGFGENWRALVPSIRFIERIRVHAVEVFFVSGGLSRLVGIVNVLTIPTTESGGFPVFTVSVCLEHIPNHVGLSISRLKLH